MDKMNLKRKKNYPTSCTDWHRCEHCIEDKESKYSFIIPNAIITTAESGYVQVPLCEDCVIEFINNKK